IAEWGQLHEVVAAFSFGRETILPRMFRRILENLGMGRSQAPVFHYFLDRHIELDRDIHGPAAYQLLTELWAEDLDRWQEAVRAGREAIDARVRLWDAVGQAVGGMESRPHSGTVA
ncbi:MAG: DUF3050 domain-containing protein, partial [Thermoplasmata archaeon]|nr:DUF3050 domain-containing protein [Thermoplasmata archaeon]NIY06406.1 DUF3050 domain-containing protein [Thermoplasmata archaeon]